jgi:hypothetical protein
MTRRISSASTQTFLRPEAFARTGRDGRFLGFLQILVGLLTAHWLNERNKMALGGKKNETDIPRGA